ncbi:MAG: PAS domain S-box protein [Terracidiphilus sp.]|jgi:PAS domain S-box-containing protein
MGFLRPYLERAAEPDSGDLALTNDSFLLSALLENTTDNIYFKDVESRFVRINRVMAKTLHLADPREAIGKSDRDFFAVQHASDALQDEVEIMRSGQPMIGKEEQEDWPDGRITWASTSKMPLFNAAGKCIGTFGISRDITSSQGNRQALLESEARFRDLTNSIREVFWILDFIDNKILYVSPAYEEIWRRPRADLYADAGDWMSVVHDEDRTRVEECYAAKVDRPFELTFRIRRTDGEVRWIRSRGFPITDRDGAVLRIVGISADITEPRKAHQALAKTQRLLASIVNSSDGAIVSQSLDGKITSWNPAAERIFGYTPLEAIGASADILRRDETDADAIWILDQVCQGLSVQNFKTELRHKDGSMVAVSLTAAPIRDELGEIIGSSSQAHNISERKKLEDKLSVVSEQLRAVLETTNECMIVLDCDWRVTYQNRLRSGLDPSSTFGKILWDSSPYLLGTSFERESRRAMTERIPCRFEDYFGPLKAWMSGVAYPTGTGLLILVRDETEKHTLDDQLRSAQKMEAIGQLAAGIAHEINTPIQFIGDNTGFMKDSWNQVDEVLASARELRDEAARGAVSQSAIDRFDTCSRNADVEYLKQEVPRAIEQTLDGVQRVAKIVSAMKEFSHPGSQEKRSIDLNRAIETTVTISRNEWRYVADVQTHLAPNLPMVPCLAGEINQVLLNLLVNAAHAIADVAKVKENSRGTITISTRQDGDSVELAIADTGTGIPEHARERVFDPFFTTKEIGKGTGQGLMLAQTVVVKKHGGRIWFETEIGKGTTFFVRLPL